MKVLISLIDTHTYFLPSRQKWQTDWKLNAWERRMKKMERSLDSKGRWRHRTVAFRVSEEEAKLLNDCVNLSGLTKQDYIIRKLLNREVIVQGNPRVYKALRNEMVQIDEELQQISSTEEVSDELLFTQYLQTHISALQPSPYQPQHLLMHT